MGAKVSADTIKAMKYYDKVGGPEYQHIGRASRKAGIETSTLRRAIERRQASATALDAVAVLAGKQNQQ